MKKIIGLSEERQILSYEILFPYWARELLRAFSVLAYKSMYELEEPISIKNIYIADLGIKVFIKNEVYGKRKEQGIQNHLFYEAKLLRNFAEVLTEIILKTSKFPSQLNSNAEVEALINPELKCIIDECYKALDKVQESEEVQYNKEIENFI